MFNTALTNGAGGLIIGPPGTYNVDNLSLPANTTLQLDPLCILKRRANGVLLTPAGAGCKITGGTLDGNSFTGHLILIAAVDCAVDGVSVINTPSGSNSIQFNDLSHRIRITRCKTDGSIVGYNSNDIYIIDNPSVGGQIGVNSTSLANTVAGVWIERNNILSNVSGLNEVLVVHMQAPSTTPISDVHVNQNRCITAMSIAEGISIPVCNDVTCHGNYVGVSGAGTITNTAYEFATTNRISCVGNHLVGGAAIGNAFTFHGCIDWVAEANTVSGLTVNATSKAFLVYTDASSTPTKNGAISHNTIQLPSGVAAAGVYIQVNGASAACQDITVDHNSIVGDATANTSIAVGIHTDNGTINGILVDGNKFRTVDTAISYGLITNFTMRNNEAIGTGRNLVTQSGSAPAGLLINAQNSWNWQAAVPTTGSWFRSAAVWNTAAASGGIPGWVCVATGSPGTWRKMAVLQTS